MGYFASRSAAMGPVGAAVVTATFYSFSPDLIGEVIPRAWTLASPEAIVAARWRVADTALRRMLGDRVDSPEVAQAAELIRRATEGLDVSGRPLFAAHTELPRPVEPHLAPELGATPRAAPSAGPAGGRPGSRRQEPVGRHPGLARHPPIPLAPCPMAATRGILPHHA
jgi:hypothetical protein